MFKNFKTPRILEVLVLVFVFGVCILIAKELEKIGAKWLYAWIGFLAGMAFCYVLSSIKAIMCKKKEL
jgi:hydrogenase/urease accessory protein HupE